MSLSRQPRVVASSLHDSGVAKQLHVGRQSACLGRSMRAVLLIYSDVANYWSCELFLCYTGLKCQLSGDAPQNSWSSINDVHYFGVFV